MPPVKPRVVVLLSSQESIIILMMDHSKRSPRNKCASSLTLSTVLSHSSHITALKGLDYTGRRVNFTSLKMPDTGLYHGPTVVKLIYMFEDINNFLRGSHAAGTTVVMDATGFGVSHLSTLSLSFLKQSSQYFTVRQRTQQTTSRYRELGRFSENFNSP